MSWTIDASHSHATFSVRHMVISTVKGQFNVIRGTLNIDVEHPENSWVEAEADAASISTGDAGRDNHLRSADFFEVEKYPLITFKSTKVEPTGDQEYDVTGDLTIHGVTKSVVFKTELIGQTTAWGAERTGLHATTKINRKEFGLTWNSLIETGGAVVSDEVKIELDIEATKPL